MAVKREITQVAPVFDIQLTDKPRWMGIGGNGEWIIRLETADY